MDLPLPSPPLLFAVMVAGELFLMRSRFSSDGSRITDQGSLWIVLVAIGISVGLARLAKQNFPQATYASLLGHPAAASALYWAGLGFFTAGLALRWYSMSYLGRSFTYDVAVTQGQQVVDSGPYRLIRHPAYTGSMLSFAGLGLCSGNYVSLLVLVVPIALALLHRIAIEEAALATMLGRRYTDYARATKRLVPFVY